MLYQTILSDASVYRLLIKLDQDIAAEARKRGCPCHDRLHSSCYARKPQGVPKELEEAFSSRCSFSCAVKGCRKRTTPPSFRFLSRLIYVAVVCGCGGGPADGASTRGDPVTNRHAHQFLIIHGAVVEKGGRAALLPAAPGRSSLI